MSMKTFRNRIRKYMRIPNLEERDRKRVHQIIKLIWQKGGSIEPKLLRKSIRMTPRRYYEYLSWLGNKRYIIQEKRGKPLHLTLKGQKYWATRNIREMIKEAEAPEQVLQQVVSEFVKIDRERAFKEIMPIVSKALNDLAKRMHKIYQNEVRKMEAKDWMFLVANESLALFESWLDKQGFEVVGEWEGLRRKES